MAILTIIKEIKLIHPDYICFVKTGKFYNIYGKDAGIISNLFLYQIKEMEDTIICGFPVNSLAKVKAKIEEKKINYIIVDRKIKNIFQNSGW